MGNVRIPSTNVCIIAGRIAREPEYKILPSGQALCATAICNSRWRKGANGAQGKEEPTFIDVKAWAVSADILAKICKGRPVQIVGRIEQESWTDKPTGAQRSKLVLVASEIFQLDWDDESAQPARSTQSKPQPQHADDDIPF